MLYVKKDSKDCNHSFYFSTRKIKTGSLEVIIKCKRCSALKTNGTDQWYKNLECENPNKDYELITEKKICEVCKK